ncbi:hypothetical protein D5018_07915 [Parashewanella curva]|uniref:Uncharacterized protein n=1 Tax=Parashewanella curva TaxID=2338552 RepID=A0A3L8Q079_9GAMM|nr:hypothetical protein [Parashewanella curva]RLV60183.1 hypothetical protein D5018_07915 [Parashewanella curva]
MAGGTINSVSSDSREFRTSTEQSLLLRKLDAQGNGQGQLRVGKCVYEVVVKAGRFFIPKCDERTGYAAATGMVCFGLPSDAAATLAVLSSHQSITGLCLSCGGGVGGGILGGVLGAYTCVMVYDKCRSNRCRNYFSSPTQLRLARE